MRLACVYLAILAMGLLALGRPGHTPGPAGLQTGDQVRIRPINVDPRYAPLFDLDLTVNPEGKISIPSFDLELDVLSLQPEIAEVLIRSELRDASDLHWLDLSILATREALPLPGQYCVTVGGAVRSPGPIALKPRMTLAEAVEAAGGPTTRAITKRVRLYRQGHVMTLDLGNPAHANRAVAQNDTIDLPARIWRTP